MLVLELCGNLPNYLRYGELRRRMLVMGDGSSRWAGEGWMMDDSRDREGSSLDGGIIGFTFWENKTWDEWIIGIM